MASAWPAEMGECSGERCGTGVMDCLVRAGGRGRGQGAAGEAGAEIGGGERRAAGGVACLRAKSAGGVLSGEAVPLAIEAGERSGDLGLALLELAQVPALLAELAAHAGERSEAGFLPVARANQGDRADLVGAGDGAGAPGSVPSENQAAVRRACLG